MEMIQTQQKAGLTAAQTLTTLRVMDSTSNLAITKRDVHNYRAKIRREDLDGKTPIQALLFQIETDFLIFNEHDEKQRIIRLAFFHKKELSLLQQHPEILIMDSIYKTN